MNEKIESLDQFKQGFSQEIFDKASKAFLKNNLLIPHNIKDGCLYVVTTVDSNLDEMDNVKLAYSCKLIAGIKVSNEVFSEIFEFCFESQYLSEEERDEAMLEQEKQGGAKQEELKKTEVEKTKIDGIKKTNKYHKEMPESNDDNPNDNMPEISLMPGDEVKFTTLTAGLPFLTYIFYILAILGLIGGIFMGSELWPGDPKIGYEWKFIAYTQSTIWIASGIIECAIFAAIGRALFYLKGIYENSQHK